MRNSLIEVDQALSYTLRLPSQIYPDDTHSMSTSRTHFYLSMENFLTSCFDEVAQSDETSGRFAVKTAAVAGI